MNIKSLVLIAAVALTAGTIVARPADEPAATRPKLKLSVSTHHGFLPMQVTLKGDLTDVDPDAWARCLVRVEWKYRTPAGFDLSSLDELPCLDEESAATIPASFEKTLRPKEPGTYSYRIILEPRDGRRIAGMTQEVRVFRSPLELRVTGDHAE